MFWIPKKNQNYQITYRESSWQNPNWSHQDWAANIIGINCIALINPTAPSNNSCLLAKLRRLMIIANTFRLSSKLGWNNSSRVSNISNIYCAFSYEQDNRTWTWPILHWLDISFHKFVFRHSTPLTHCPNNIQRELRLTRNYIMQLITQKLSTALPTVPVENGEELNLFLRLFRIIWLHPRFFKVKDDRDAIFVIVAEYAIVSIGSIGDEIWWLGLLGHFSLLDYWSLGQ